MGVARKCLFFWLWFPLLAHAAIFMCKDSAGRTLTSDRPLPECADRHVREYSRNGIFKREIAALPTPEQKRLLLEQQRQKRAEEERRREQQRADRAFMLRYQSEENIELARQRESASLINLIAQHRAALELAQEERDAAEGKPTGQEGATSRMRDIKQRLQESEEELAHINNKFDAMLKRYRDIVSR